MLECKWRCSDLHDLAEIIREIEQLASVPHEVTRTKRLAIITMSAAAPLLPAMFLILIRDISLPATFFWVFAILFICVAVPAIIAAAVAGGGWILLTLGIGVVDRHGVTASGSLASRRSLIAWLPALASPALFPAFMIWFTPVTAAAFTLALLGLIAILSALLPHRSLQDRLAGTWLVPR